MELPEILDALRSIPEGVWGAFVGAAIAFIGTVLSNRHARKQLKLQLEHASIEASTSRAIEMRRDVYLESAGAVSSLQSLLTRLIEPDADQQQLARDANGYVATLSRIHVVGCEDTVTGIVELTHTWSRGYMKLAQARLPLTQLWGEIQAYENIASKHSAQVENTIDEMRRADLAGSNAAMETLQRHLALQKRWKDDATARAIALRIELIDKQIALVPLVTDEAIALVNCLPPLIESARAELKLPMKKEVYEQLTQTQNDRMRAMMGDLVGQLRQLNAELKGSSAEATVPQAK